MAKQTWKPGNMLYPLPAVLITVADQQGNPNIFTVAWAGTVCSDPAMVSISVRPSRYSHHMIELHARREAWNIWLQRKETIDSERTLSFFFWSRALSEVISSLVRTIQVHLANRR